MVNLRAQGCTVSEAYAVLQGNYDASLDDTLRRFTTEADKGTFKEHFVAHHNLSPEVAENLRVCVFAGSADILQERTEQLLCELCRAVTESQGDVEWWLRATTTESAGSVLRNGIQPSVGRRNCDFGISGSFYLHPENQVELAVTWVVRRGRAVPSDVQPPSVAILFYRTSRGQRESHTPNFVFQDAGAVWQRVVMASRNRRTRKEDRDLLVTPLHDAVSVDSIQWVLGPILKIVDAIPSTPILFNDGVVAQQLALKQPEVSQYFDACCVAALFAR